MRRLILTETPDRGSIRRETVTLGNASTTDLFGGLSSGGKLPLSLVKDPARAAHFRLFLLPEFLNFNELSPQLMQLFTVVRMARSDTRTNPVDIAGAFSSSFRANGFDKPDRYRAVMSRTKRELQLLQARKVSIRCLSIPFLAPYATEQFRCIAQFSNSDSQLVQLIVVEIGNLVPQRLRPDMSRLKCFVRQLQYGLSESLQLGIPGSGSSRCTRFTVILPVWQQCKQSFQPLQ